MRITTTRTNENAKKILKSQSIITSASMRITLTRSVSEEPADAEGEDGLLVGHTFGFSQPASPSASAGSSLALRVSVSGTPSVSPSQPRLRHRLVLACASG